MLSIAGSDSGGGAGIQADLKAFARCGVHGCTAITAVTAQNTLGVTAVEHLTPAAIHAQIAAVIADIHVDAVKIGMLGRVETIQAVRQSLEDLEAGTPVVLDPVMVAESGSRLLEADAEHALRELLTEITVTTPNLGEARVLAGVGFEDADGAELARAVQMLGPVNAVVTAGHAQTSADWFFDGSQLVEIPGERFPSKSAHGSGCTHSSVLAACLAKGDTPLTAATTARQLAGEAVRDGLDAIGSGPGPVNVLGLQPASS